MPEEMWGVHGSMNYNVHVHVLSLWDKISTTPDGEQNHSMWKICINNHVSN